MFYVIDHLNLETQEAWSDIRTKPGRKNMSGEAAEVGWLGTTGCAVASAQGAFATIEEARQRIEDQTEGSKIERDHDVSPWEMDQLGVVERWRPALRAMNITEAQVWADQIMRMEITANSTERDIDAFVRDRESDAAAEGLILPRMFRAAVVEHRDECVAEAAEDLND